MPEPQTDIYDPEYVADLFDRCSANYRRWSAVSSFGFVWLWRRQCVARLVPPAPGAQAVDLMAGTGEVWPHLLRRFPDLAAITAIDISHRMHLDAVARLHGAYGDRIQHLQANTLETDLPGESADLVISTFGLKTFNPDQQARLAKQIARLLRPGGSFSLIEASDPVGWWGRPLYRLYLDRVLPWVERLFLNGAQDFTMIGPYSKRFGTSAGMAQALQAQGLDVVLRNHVFGCATSVAGTKPMSREATDLSPCPPTP